MSFRMPSLRVAIPLLVIAVGLLIVTLFLSIELRQTNMRATANAIRELDVLSGIIVETVETGLRRGDALSVRDALRPIRTNRLMPSAAILDDENRVIGGTDRGSAGKLISRTHFASDVGLVDSVRVGGHSQYRIEANGMSLLWARPFSMPPRNGELLPTRRGVLLAKYGLGMSRAQTLRDAFARTRTAVLMIALLCVLVMWVFHRYFAPRIDALVLATESIAAGKYRAVTAVGGEDEIAKIGQAIVQMAATLEREQAKLRRSEHSLRTLNAELEYRVEKRTSEAIGYSLDMEAFAFMISHDLRTPLRSIVGFAQMLAEDNAATIGPQGLENIGRVLLNAKRMNRLMDDILALTRHGRQPVQTVKVNVKALIEEVVVVQLAEYEDASRIHVQIDDVPPAMANESLLRQALQNILSNAVKYSEIREVAEIRIGATVDERGPIYFVSDNGVGFEMKYALQIFAPFKRLHAPTEYEGTGVGLAIVKRVFDRHGGRVWVKSEFGVGTTFYFAFFAAAEADDVLENEEGEVFRRVGELARGRNG